MKAKSNNRNFFAGKTGKTLRLVLVALIGLIALVETAAAQSVVAPPPAFSVTPPAVLEAPPSEMQVFSPENPITSYPTDLEPLQLGPVGFRPHVFYQFLYGSGIQSSPGQSHDTIVQSFAPGLMLVLNPHWTLDYTPTFTFYSQNSFQDNVGQSVILTGGASFENWTFGLMQSFTYSSEPEVQTGTQTDQQNYLTALTASCPLNSKLSVDLGLNQTLSYPSDFQSFREWSTLDWLNYEFWPRFTAGVGAGFGYVSATPDTAFEQVQGRVAWRPADKISLSSTVGVQYSQFTEGSEDPLVNLIFSDAIQYQPFEQTKITFSANQTVLPSYYTNQLSVVTSVNGDLQQRLLGKLFLDVDAGYNWNNYVAAASGVTADSSSDFYTVNVRLSATILKRGTVSVFYNYSDNITSQSGLDFSSNQVGFNVGYRY